MKPSSLEVNANRLWGGSKGGAVWDLKSLHAQQHPGKVAWEWCTSGKQVSILRGSGAYGCPHSHVECSFFCRICTSPTQNAHFLSDLHHSHANRQDVKGCERGVKGLKGLKTPNGVPPSDSPRLFNLRNLVQTSRVDG